MGIAGVGAWTAGGNRVRRAELALPCSEVAATPGGRFTNRASVGIGALRRFLSGVLLGFVVLLFL